MSDEQSISQVQPVRTAHGDQHHGVQGMVQRTARALSPWTRRWYQAGNRPQPLMPRLAGRVSAPLVMRVQRVAAPGGEQPALTDRFSALIVQRHAAANDLSRRYQVGLRRPLGPSPSQLPLPGVPATRSPEPVLQRQAMSLEELAESFGAGSLGGPLPSPMSRPALEGNPEQGVEPATPPRLADLQEQARRAAQRRPSPPATAAGEPAQLQRAPAQPGDPNFSIAAAIEERIRQARARRSGSHPAAPPPGEPSATAGAPIQRAPAQPAIEPPRPPLVAPTPPDRVQRAAGESPVPRELPVKPTSEPGQPGYSKTAAIAERIRQARLQRASPSAAGRGAHEANASPPPVLPQSPDPDSPHYSKSAEIAERIRQAQARRSSPQGNAAPRFSPNPQDSNYSRAAEIKERLERARVQRQSQTRPLAPGAGEPSSGVSAQLSGPAQAQRAAGASGPLPASPVSPGPDVGQATSGSPAAGERDGPLPSLAAQIEERIRQAQQRRQDAGAPPMTPVGPPDLQRTVDPSSPEGSIAAAMRERIEQARARLFGEAATSPLPPGAPLTASPASSPTSLPASSFDVQRTPETRPPVVRDLRMQPGIGASPQVRRLRALSRTQVLTPERKTGDFTAGETTPAAKMVRRSPTLPPAQPAAGADEQPVGKAQRSTSRASAAPTPMTPPPAPAASPAPVTAPAPLTENDETALQRSPDGSAVMSPAPVAAPSPFAPPVQRVPAAPPEVQRPADSAPSATPRSPAATPDAPTQAQETPAPPEPVLRRAPAPDISAEITAPDAPAEGPAERKTEPPARAASVQRTEAQQPPAPKQRPGRRGGAKPGDARLESVQPPTPATAAETAPAGVQRAVDQFAGGSVVDVEPQDVAPQPESPDISPAAPAIQRTAEALAPTLTEQVQRSSAPEGSASPEAQAALKPSEAEASQPALGLPATAPASAEPVVRREAAPARASDDAPPRPADTIEAAGAPAPEMVQRMVETLVREAAAMDQPASVGLSEEARQVLPHPVSAHDEARRAEAVQQPPRQARGPELAPLPPTSSAPPVQRSAAEGVAASIAPAQAAASGSPAISSEAAAPSGDSRVQQEPGPAEVGRTLSTGTSPEYSIAPSGPAPVQRVSKPAQRAGEPEHSAPAPPTTAPVIQETIQRKGEPGQTPPEPASSPVVEPGALDAPATIAPAGSPAVEPPAIQRAVTDAWSEPSTTGAPPAAAAPGNTATPEAATLEPYTPEPRSSPASTALLPAQAPVVEPDHAPAIAPAPTEQRVQRSGVTGAAPTAAPSLAQPAPAPEQPSLRPRAEPSVQRAPDSREVEPSTPAAPTSGPPSRRETAASSRVDDQRERLPGGPVEPPPILEEQVQRALASGDDSRQIRGGASSLPGEMAGEVAPRFGSPAVASHDEPELRTRLPVESPVLGQRAARRGMALIQRALDPRVSAKPGLAHPQRAVISRPQAAATVHPPQEPMAQPLPSPEPSATRGQREVSAHVPLASRGGSPGDVIRRTPQHPPRRAEPGDGAGQGSGASRQAARQATMPLAKLRTGTGAETVQRQTEGGQRPDAPPVEAAQTARPAPPAVAGQPPTGKVARGGGVEEMLNTDDREDLDEVARAILPLVKRLLTTERERRLFR